jgi:RHS repeat-associated protein
LIFRFYIPLLLLFSLIGGISEGRSVFSQTIYFKNHLVKNLTEPSTQTTTLAYNGKNLVSSKTDPTGAITYGYDDSGLLESVTEGAATISRTYDERGRLKTYTNADGDLIQYRYDANNNLTLLTYPDGKQVNYTYNARNLLESVTDWNNRVTSYQYDRIGRLTGTIRPNGTANLIAHDAACQLTSIKETANGKLISYLKFDYDAAGQITRRFRAPLVNSGWQQPSFSATYDDDNRLASINGQSITHDADGNMTFGPIRQDSGHLNLSYNSRNQLISADGLSYSYDAEGQRRTITNTSGTSRDVIDPSSSLSRLLIRHHPDNTKTYYVYGLGLLYEVDQAGKTKTHHYDQVGSTILRTDDTGKVIGKAEFSAFGITFWKQGDMETPFLYNGQAGVQTDSNGLLHMRARYYSPYLMRFLNADPIGFSGGSNWFAYAGGDPISKSDPYGLYETFGEYLGEVGDVWKGYGDAAVGTVTGLYNVVAHPIQTAKGVGQAISHPIQTYNNISETVSELSQTNRGMGRIIGEVLITGATAGGGLASGTTKTANIMRSSQASGMTVRQALKAYDVGSQALNAADYAALGSRTTSALEKAAMIQAGYQITTKPIEGFIQSLTLAHTGLRALLKTHDALISNGLWH